MTDLEMTKRCATAMCLETYQLPFEEKIRTPLPNGFDIIYDPLHDDAQAMALMKKFHLSSRRVCNE